MPQEWVHSETRSTSQIFRLGKHGTGNLKEPIGRHSSLGNTLWARDMWMAVAVLPHSFILDFFFLGVEGWQVKCDILWMLELWSILQESSERFCSLQTDWPVVHACLCALSLTLNTEWLTEEAKRGGSHVEAHSHTCFSRNFVLCAVTCFYGKVGFTRYALCMVLVAKMWFCRIAYHLYIP